MGINPRKVGIGLHPEFDLVVEVGPDPQSKEHCFREKDTCRGSNLSGAEAPEAGAKSSPLLQGGGGLHSARAQRPSQPPVPPPGCRSPGGWLRRAQARAAAQKPGAGGGTTLCACSEDGAPEKSRGRPSGGHGALLDDSRAAAAELRFLIRGLEHRDGGESGQAALRIT